MIYEGTVYRPPSEARSLIIQVTIGCANNECTFCSMYKDKHFRMRTINEIFADLDEMSDLYGHLPLRIFLADGDALVLKTEYLLQILDHINEKFPNVSRITSYATAKDIVRKTDEDLKLLKQHGLDMVYVGAESGNAEILKKVHKNVTVEEMIEASEKTKRAGIAMSVTFISGLGGPELLKEHAIDSAKLVTAMKPEYVGFLTLMLEYGAPMREDYKAGRFKYLTPMQVVEEMRIFLSNVDSEGTVFRSNHASNYIVLKGDLNSDIPSMLKYLDAVEEKQQFRPESFRRL